MIATVDRDRETAENLRAIHDAIDEAHRVAAELRDVTKQKREERLRG